MQKRYQTLPVTGPVPKPGELVIMDFGLKGVTSLPRHTLRPPEVALLQIFQLHPMFQKR
ncbi:hypothetical protein [Chromobacterium amazonense]|uniref:hypothetical protein n=1 Tax=Chromobacterium amazonense TaxID=1382803 RepID=UPI001670CE02|nr:hypothetical protein [Chromobacterium amazonense]